MSRHGPVHRKPAVCSIFIILSKPRNGKGQNDPEGNVLWLESLDELSGEEIIEAREHLGLETQRLWSVLLIKRTSPAGLRPYGNQQQSIPYTAIHRAGFFMLRDVSQDGNDCISKDQSLLLIKINE
jgi:hypothetical protein